MLSFREWKLWLAVTVAVLCLVVALSPGRVTAQHVPTAFGQADGFAFEVITVSTVAIGATAATINPTTAPGAKVMYCTLEAQPIRYRFDGTAPTSLVGHPAVAGATITLTGANSITRFRAIRSGGVDASLSCTYSR